MNKTVFLSYGHDEYKDLAFRLKKDLEDAGFCVWIDKQIRGTRDWEIEIENGITYSNWLVLLMTNHSVRRPDGVCLDEVSYARGLGKPIAPIMIQNVHPPLCIARIQWIDMMHCIDHNNFSINETEYQSKKEQLLEILNGIRQLETEGGQRLLNSTLLPLDNDVYVDHLRRDFYGREHLIRYYTKWYRSNERVMWIKGKAGIGKTAFVAELAGRQNEIKGVYFCRFNDNERSNPKRAIMSIAYYLTTQIDTYRELILSLDFQGLQEKTSRRLFEYLITEPLNKLSYQKEPIVFIIDALDEATNYGKNDLADVLSDQLMHLPSWIKWIITSRDDLLLRRRLGTFYTVDLDVTDIDKNLDDIRGYLNENLLRKLEKLPNKDDLIEAITKRSEGVFLYAKMAAEDIIHDRIEVSNVTNIPYGLTGIYYNYFRRIFDFSKYDYRESVRPVMEVLCTMFQPLEREVIINLLDVDEYDFDDIAELLFEMFPIKEHLLQPIHKSLVDWLLDGDRSGEYRVSAQKGHQKISNYFENHPFDNYAIRYLVEHYIHAQNYLAAQKWLTTDSYISERIHLEGLDTAIRKHIRELGFLYEKDYFLAKEVYASSTFIQILAKYRKYLYNSGLYFELKKYNFNLFIDSVNYNQWPVEAQISVAYYFYITESYDKAIAHGQRLLESNNLDFIMRQELHNMIGLSFRKLVDFENAYSHFQKVLSYEHNVPSLYESSGAMMNIAKLEYHILNWEAAENYNQRAIEYLQKELLEENSKDKVLTIKLFLAEYHRLAAECLLWHGNFKAARKELTFAEEIYCATNARDRYFLRFCYTKLFFTILCDTQEIREHTCKSLLLSADSTYDKAQICFYMALYYCKIGNPKLAAYYSKQSLSYYMCINAFMEIGEVEALISAASLELPITNKIQNSDNKAIRIWIPYVRSFLGAQL